MEHSAIKQKPSYADTSDIALTPGSRFETSERVGLGYIMGIDLPRLLVPSFEVHSLTLRYEAADDAVIRGDKKEGDIVLRYGGWEALGAKKINADDRSTLAGQQIGHWLSSAALFYNSCKNRGDIALSGSSLTGEDTSDATPSPSSDTVITAQDIHKKIEYVIDKLDALQNTEIPKGCKTAVHKEYIGGCDEIPFLDCFAGKKDWLGVYWVPWYNIHKVFQGLLDVYSYAEPSLAEKTFTVLKKLADWAADGADALSDSEMQEILEIEYGGMNEIFARLFNITGCEKYKRAAKRFTHDSVIDPLMKNDTDSLSGMHANTQIPKFVGAAALYELDTDRFADYRTACENFWYNVNLERCYCIGGNSLSEHFQPSGTEELGVKTCESCNTYNMMRLTEYLYSWEHRSEYIDWYERALYNHILSQQEPETGAKMYFVSMVQGTHRIYEQKYNSWWCCTGTGMENPARYKRVMFYEEQGCVYVNLYLPCAYELKSKGLILNTETEYPYSGRIRISVSGNSAEAADIKLRVPGWISRYSKKMTVRLNGRLTAEADGGGYAEVRAVKAGDILDIEIPLGISLYHSRSGDKIAYEYGPLVLAARLGGEVKRRYEYIWEERSAACQQTFYPALMTSDGKGIDTADDIAGYIHKFGEKAEFILPADRNSAGQDMILVPFSDIAHGFHNIYFDLDKAIDTYSIRLSGLQLDEVEPDGQQSELGHGMLQSTENETPFRRCSVQGTDEHGQYRFAYGNGFFKYNMLVDGSADKNYLILRYIDDSTEITADTSDGQKTFNVNFDIYINGILLSQIAVSEPSGEVVDHTVEIPRKAVELCSGTDEATGLYIAEILLKPRGEDCCTAKYRKIYIAAGDPAK